VSEELGRAITYWLDHPWRLIGFYMLANFAGGFVRAAGRDLARTWQRKRLQQRRSNHGT